MLPQRLEQIVEDFKYSEGREKIELLVDFAERMPPLPDHLPDSNKEMEQVHECMTPVFVQAQLENGGMHFYFDVPAESPTVRGFAAILAQGLDGATPEQILSLPNDFYYEMGLNEVLSMQRMRGFDGILAHLKKLATEALGKPA
jgi:cysteine desulfuration protein SufE